MIVRGLLLHPVYCTCARRLELIFPCAVVRLREWLAQSAVESTIYRMARREAIEAPNREMNYYSIDVTQRSRTAVVTVAWHANNRLANSLHVLLRNPSRFLARF